MTDTPTLRITCSLEGESLTVTLHGDIDVTAAPVLSPLHTDPPASRRAVLDFTDVVRVNSMGLAQLMRLLEAWHGRGVGMEARNPNRTVSMLFKMTGMNRYFGGADAAAAAGPAAPAAPSSGAAAPVRPAASARPNQPALRRVVRSVPPPAAAATPATAPSATVAAGPAFSSPATPQVTTPAVPASAPVMAPSGKLNFIVHLQSNQQLSGWYYLNTLLQRTLEQPIALDIQQLGAPTDGATLPSIAFVPPFDACALMTRHGYLPVAWPHNDADEVSIVVREDEPRAALPDFAGARVVTATERSFVQLLGRFCCDEEGADSNRLAYSFTGNEITALRTLVQGQADLLFMLQRNYHQLSPLSRSGTRVLHDSSTGMASHLLLLHPAHRDLVAPLRTALLDLGQGDKGRQALQDLGMSRWVEPQDDEIRMLQMLYQRYVPA